MTEAARRTFPRARLKIRKREVQQCLADFGIIQGRIRLWRGPRFEDTAAVPGHRFRAALEKLGPVFSSFGAYLGSRTDLVPPSLCASMPSFPALEALPLREVQEIIFRELGRAPADAFATFKEHPFEVGLLYQCHNACFHNGTSVVVKVVKPHDDEGLAADLESLDLLSQAFADDEEVRQGLKSAAADFRYVVELQADLVHEAGALEALAQDSEVADLLYVPRVYRELSTKRILTLEHQAGWPLQEILSSAKSLSLGACVEAPLGPPPEDLGLRGLASSLSTIWLRLALLGSSFPIEPGTRTVYVLPDGRLAFTGPLTSLPSGTKRELWDYLLATATEDPDVACMHLLRILEKGARSAPEEELRHQFRQVVLFRDGAEEGLTGLLKVHRRLAGRRGWREPPYLTRFYRGLFLMNDTASRFAGGRDSLRDGLENVRVQAAVGQFRKLLSIGQLNRNLEQYAPALLQLPKRWDEVLTLLAEGRVHIQVQVRETAEQRRRKNSAAIETALLLVLAGIALLAHHLSHNGTAEGWGRQIGAAVFVVVGGLLLCKLGWLR